METNLKCKIKNYQQIVCYGKNMIDNLSIMDKLVSKHKYKCSKGGFLMLTVTDKASEVIKDFLKDKDQAAAVRITMSIG